MEKVKSPIIPHREPYSLLLTATCPCCGKQVSFAHTTMKPEVEDLIKKEQGKIYIHHDRQCGGAGVPASMGLGALAEIGHRQPGLRS